MNKHEDLPTGFTTIKEAKDCRWIAFCDDDGMWRSLHNGYQSLLRAGFAALLELGLDPDDADDAGVLYRFMEGLGKELKNK
jgi:hypothetical protein